MILCFITFLMLMTSCSNRLVSVLMNFEASSVRGFQQNTTGVHNTHKVRERKVCVRLICADGTLACQEMTPRSRADPLGYLPGSCNATEYIRLEFVSFSRQM
jgi:hypothetical protein